GDADAQRHLEACATCQAELDRMHQRVARLKALPTLKPARSQWPVVSAKLRERKQHRLVRWAGLGGLAAAASIAFILGVRSGQPADATEQLALSEAMERSQALEQVIQSYNPEARVTDGRTIRMANQLERQIASVDQQLEVAQLARGSGRDEALLRLWRQRVGLLDALVDVHVTRATAVGF
ncbi:MAG TPA: hypothetical protein VG817_03095, partial [Gemmatimonadales bacterium]|nr:hypothetical protein [Gemmatimonadales bacterium]